MHRGGGKPSTMRRCSSGLLPLRARPPCRHTSLSSATRAPGDLERRWPWSPWPRRSRLQSGLRSPPPTGGVLFSPGDDLSGRNRRRRASASRSAAASSKVAAPLYPLAQLDNLTDDFLFLTSVCPAGRIPGARERLSRSARRWRRRSRRRRRSAGGRGGRGAQGGRPLPLPSGGLQAAARAGALGGAADATAARGAAGGARRKIELLSGEDAAEIQRQLDRRRVGGGARERRRHRRRRSARKPRPSRSAASSTRRSRRRRRSARRRRPSGARVRYALRRRRRRARAAQQAELDQARHTAHAAQESSAALKTRLQKTQVELSELKRDRERLRQGSKRSGTSRP